VISRQLLSTLLLAATILLVLLAAATLLPSGSPHRNDLGYPSLCPFAPYSTVGLLVPAGLAYLIRTYLKKQA
jgi:hypothetical protein